MQNQHITGASHQPSRAAAAITVISPFSSVQETNIEAFCEMCSETALDTPALLERKGWGLYDTFQFCPYHEEMI